MNNKNEQTFCGKHYGENLPPLIVAEIGFNHNGDVDLAYEMITSAAKNGADIIKLQTFVGRELISKTLRTEDPDQPGNEIFLYEFFQRYELTPTEYDTLFKYARKLGVPIFSTPFDETSLEMLLDLGMSAVKVASPDLTYLPFLRRVAQTGLPIVLSTGMGTKEEIGTALETIKSADNKNIILLHCVSNYPSQYNEMNLTCIKELSSQFKVPVGLSDHTMGTLSGIVATAMGAVMIEKHFTTNRNLPGVDQKISMEPMELADLKEATVNARILLGDGIKQVQISEELIKKTARRSLVARIDIAKNTPITYEMISFKRPGTGIPSSDLEKVVGQKAKNKILAEQVITWEMFDINLAN